MLWLNIITVCLSLLVTLIGLTSQWYKNKIRRSTKGLSLHYFLLLGISYNFWVMYGLYQGDFVIIVPMTIGAIMSWAIVLQFSVYKK